jgi:hypothetical protein
MGRGWAGGGAARRAEGGARGADRGRPRAAAPAPPAYALDRRIGRPAAAGGAPVGAPRAAGALPTARREVLPLLLLFAGDHRATDPSIGLLVAPCRQWRGKSRPLGAYRRESTSYFGFPSGIAVKLAAARLAVRGWVGCLPRSVTGLV